MIANTCCCGGKEKELTLTIMGRRNNYGVMVNGLDYGSTSGTGPFHETIKRGTVIKVYATPYNETATIRLNGANVKSGTSISYDYAVTDYSVNIQIYPTSTFLDITELK